MSLFKIFQHAPFKPEIEDPEEVKKRYKYWRIRIFLSMYAGYACFYLTRKSFTFAMPAMMATMGYTKADLGILASILYITYGLSKFVSGFMSDRSNPRYFMAIGLIATGIFNICFGLSSSLLFFAIFWGLNGWFQGWGWPPCARLLTHWYSRSERGTWWGAWSTSHNVGGALIPLVVAVIAELWGWRVSMFVPGIACILFGLVLMNRLRDTPQSLGLPSIEKYRNKNGVEPSVIVEEEKALSKREALFDYVLKNRFIWILAVAYFFVYIVRTAINDWGAIYLYESQGYTLVMASTCIFCFELGGFFGSFISGWFSDKVFKGKRGPVNVLFAFFAMLVLVAFWYVPSQGFMFAASAMFFIGLFIFGPQVLIGVAAAELSHKNAAGTATGFIGWFAYAGAATAGFPLSKITHEWGWGVFFIVLSICGLLAVALLMPLWSVKSRTQIAPKPAAGDTTTA